VAQLGGQHAHASASRHERYVQSPRYP
jgi:hypothetical protein